MIQARRRATDHLGSVRQLLDGSETIVEHREYDSFGTVDEVFQWIGEEYQSVGSAGMLSQIAHAGSFWEEGPGHYRKGARVYDPSTGTFLSEDPIGYADGSNPYRYAGNDPVNFVDPTGLSQAGHDVLGRWEVCLRRSQRG